MSAEIILFPGITSLNLNPDRLLIAAQEQLERVVILGVTKDGDEYFASSVADGGDVVWMLERAKYKLMKMSES